MNAQNTIAAIGLAAALLVAYGASPVGASGECSGQRMAVEASGDGRDDARDNFEDVKGSCDVDGDQACRNRIRTAESQRRTADRAYEAAKEAYRTCERRADRGDND